MKVTKSCICFELSRMANFPPLKERFLQTLDLALAKVDLQGNFLDFGCGRGDVAKHLKQRYHLEGDVVEASPETRDLLAQDAQFDGLGIFDSLDQIGRESYGLITAFDVIEHVSKPDELLKSLHETLQPDGLFALVMPYRPTTWGWDDEFYGHLRRWSLRGCLNAVETAGFEILHLSDPTFPVYSFMRRFMLKWRRKPSSNKNVNGRSLDSARTNSWGDVPAWVSWLPWKLINSFCGLFEEFHRGDEIFILARRVQGPAACQVCGRAEMTWKKNIGDHALQTCRFCHSQRVISGRPSSHGAAPSLLASEMSHVRDILSNQPAAKSVLEIGCAEGLLLRELKSLDWRVQGIEWRELSSEPVVDIHRGTLDDFETDEKFDLILICGELELMTDLPAAIKRMVNLLTPGGMVMIEMMDMHRLVGRIRGLLQGPTTVLNTRAVCDLLAGVDLALTRKRKLPGGRIQLWFASQS